MRGEVDPRGHLFSYFSPKSRVPPSSTWPSISTGMCSSYAPT